MVEVKLQIRYYTSTWHYRW